MSSLHDSDLPSYADGFFAFNSVSDLNSILNLRDCDVLNLRDCDVPNLRDCDVPNVRDCDVPNVRDCDVLNLRDCDVLNRRDCDFDEQIPTNIQSQYYSVNELASLLIPKTSILHANVLSLPGIIMIYFLCFLC